MISALRSVVCCFAHPDDETILAGGMITLMTQQGILVHIVSATRGEGGELGVPTEVRSHERLGAVRERELRCAADALGATAQTLGYEDPRIGPDELLFPFEADFDTLVQQIARVLRERKADLILTHGAAGEYGHPAHRLVHRAVSQAVEHLYPKALLYSVAAKAPGLSDRLWNEDEPAHLALDIRPWASAKTAAMECHRSQHALYMRHKRLRSVAEALRTNESARRVFPALEQGDPAEDSFTRLLLSAGAWRPD